MAAAGTISLAKQALRNTLAASSTFQTLVDADDAAGALASIYSNGLPKPADGRRHTLAELEGLSALRRRLHLP